MKSVIILFFICLLITKWRRRGWRIGFSGHNVTSTSEQIGWLLLVLLLLMVMMVKTVNVVHFWCRRHRMIHNNNGITVVWWVSSIAIWENIKLNNLQVINFDWDCLFSKSNLPSYGEPGPTTNWTSVGGGDLFKTFARPFALRAHPIWAEPKRFTGKWRTIPRLN